MMEAIREDRAPSYFFLHYEITGRAALPRSLAEQQLGPTNENWLVRNLLLVPSFAFPPFAIIKCPPLSPTARRVSWVGCNFDLSRVPAEARIEIISTRSSPAKRDESAQIGFEQQSNQATKEENEEVAVRKHLRSFVPSLLNQSRLTSAAATIVPPSEVREKFKRVKPLKELSVKERGWTLDVLNIVRRIVECGGTTPLSPDATRHVEPNRGHVRALHTEFTNEEVYAHAHELEQLHPDNRHVRDKIRQQLQGLRDAGVLIHVGTGLASAVNSFSRKDAKARERIACVGGFAALQCHLPTSPRCASALKLFPLRVIAPLEMAMARRHSSRDGLSCRANSRCNGSFHNGIHARSREKGFPKGAGLSGPWICGSNADKKRAANRTRDNALPGATRRAGLC